MSDKGKSCTVFVGGISWKADEESLKAFFSSYGSVVDCKIIVDRDTNKSKGYGFVTFKDIETAESVKNATDLNFLGKVMNVGNAYRKNTPSKTNNTTQANSAPYVNYPAQWQFAPYPVHGYPQVPGYVPPMHYGYAEHMQYYTPAGPSYYDQYQYWQMMNASSPPVGTPEDYYEYNGHQENPKSFENSSEDNDLDVNEASKKLSEVSLNEES